jgi:predicted N-acyltransferase
MTLLKEVKAFQSVDAIGRDSINSIADDAFFTYEWFKTLETQKTFGISPIYLAVYDNGNLVGVAPCFIDLLDQYFHYAPQVRYILPALKKMLIIGRRLGFCQEHVSLCYSPFSYRSKVLIRKNSEKNHILSLLAEKIDVVCRQERFLFSSFLFVSEFDKLLMDNLQNFSFLKCPGITTFYFDVQ